MISKVLVDDFNYHVLQTIKWKAYLNQKLSMNMNYLNNFYHGKIIRPFFYVYNYSIIPNLVFAGPDVAVYHLIKKEKFGDFINNNAFIDGRTFPPLTEQSIKNLIAGFYRYRELIKNKILEGYQIVFDDVKNITSEQVERYYSRNFIQFIEEGSVINPIKEFVNRGVYFVPVLVFDALTFKTWSRIYDEMNTNRTIIFKKEIEKASELSLDKLDSLRGFRQNKNIYNSVGINCVVVTHLLSIDKDVDMAIIKIQQQLNFLSKYSYSFRRNKPEDRALLFLKMLSKMFSFYIHDDAQGCCDIFEILNWFVNLLKEYLIKKNFSNFIEEIMKLIIVRNLTYKPASDSMSTINKFLDCFYSFSAFKKIVLLLQFCNIICGSSPIYSKKTNKEISHLLMTEQENQIQFPLIRKLFVDYCNKKFDKIPLFSITTINVLDDHFEI